MKEILAIQVNAIYASNTSDTSNANKTSASVS